MRLNCLSYWLPTFHSNCLRHFNYFKKSLNLFFPLESQRDFKMLEQEVWSVIKYKPKNGCEEEFINELKRLEKIMKENKSYSFLNTFIRLETGEFVQIAKMPNLDALLDGQVAGLEWLDSVDHILERYENDSRTDSFSGFVI